MFLQILYLTLVHVSNGNNISPFNKTHVAGLLSDFEELQINNCNKLVIYYPKVNNEAFESIISSLLYQNDHESHNAPGSYSISFLLNNASSAYLSLPPESKDYHRLLSVKNCVVALTYVDNEIYKDVHFLNKIVKVSRENSSQIDQVIFLFFTREPLAFETILKYKRIFVFSHRKVFRSPSLNPDFPTSSINLQGKSLLMSVPSYPSAIETRPGKNGRLEATRGMYLYWLEGVKKKFNFTCDFILSSNGGASGTKLENGEWTGGVGDVLKGDAHMSLDISHIYNRHHVVEWASPFYYRGLVFVVRKAEYSFPQNVVLLPFTEGVWAVFASTVVVCAICFKIVIEFVSIYGEDGGNRYLNIRNIFGYLTATFLGQRWNLPDSLALIAFVTATAYQAKLTALMGVAVASFVPTSYVELLNSDISIGINARGKGELAYIVFSSGGGHTYEGIFAKATLYPNETQCVLKTVHENFACITGEGIATYAIANSVTLNNGQSPLQLSSSQANFVEGGLIYKKGWIYRHDFDLTIRNAMNMGLISKWWQMHMDLVKADKRKSDKVAQIGKYLAVNSAGESNDDGVLNIEKLVSCFICLGVGLTAGIIIFLGTRAVGRAFVKALQQEYIASEAAAAARRDSKGGSGKDYTSNRHGMSVEEARQILNVGQEGRGPLESSNTEEIQKQFDHLFKINGTAQGGSLYIQSKVYRAKERLLDENFKSEK
ncbi:unnamed protein product [Orchesella dallaii]|uniref:Uncharacterized protein n=1 Tax=Orchesella dallaii TaxID=48710 RepID=A0ABP1RS49_9HEXA